MDLKVTMNNQKLYDRLVATTRANPETACWEWTGYVHSKRKYAAHRYGGTSIPVGKGRGRSMHSHRAMMWAIHGPLSRDQHVCHTCDNPICINPAHLFFGSHKDNMADSRKKGRHFLSAKTHCKRGHPLSGENLYIAPCDGMRHCKQCMRERLRRAYHAKKSSQISAGEKHG